MGADAGRNRSSFPAGYRVLDAGRDVVVQYVLPKDGIGAMFAEEATEHYLESFPSGYHFVPSDPTLMFDYLIPMIDGDRTVPLHNMHRVNIYNYDADQLTASFTPQGKGTWYFISTRRKKYPNGKQPDRKAGEGYWKATGADDDMRDPTQFVTVKETDPDTGELKDVIKNKIVGRRKTLVYHTGKPSENTKTKWTMQEYRVESADDQINNTNGKRTKEHDGIDDNDDDSRMMLGGFVLCKIYKSRHPGSEEADNGDGIEGGNKAKRRTVEAAGNKGAKQGGVKVRPKGKNKPPPKGKKAGVKAVNKGIVIHEGGRNKGKQVISESNSHLTLYNNNYHLYNNVMMMKPNYDYSMNVYNDPNPMMSNQELWSSSGSTSGGYFSDSNNYYQPNQLSPSYMISVQNNQTPMNLQQGHPGSSSSTGYPINAQMNYYTSPPMMQPFEGVELGNRTLYDHNNNPGYTNVYSDQYIQDQRPQAPTNDFQSPRDQSINQGYDYTNGSAHHPYHPQWEANDLLLGHGDPNSAASTANASIEHVSVVHQQLSTMSISQLLEGVDFDPNWPAFDDQLEDCFVSLESLGQPPSSDEV